MNEQASSGGVSYKQVGADYFEKRGLKRYAKVWSLWALGVGAVISGHYSGWNLGMSYGFGSMLVALFISVAAPISGMSINPARTFGSALWAHSWSGFWIYLSAPLFGMLASTELQLRLVKRDSSRLCGKVNHDETIDCFVRCGCTKGTSHD